MEWKEVEGTQNERPLELDKESSKTTVYLRRNIRRESRKLEPDGEEIEVWKYDECQISRADYAIYVAETADSKADYIAMMSDIDMEV